MRAFMSSTYGRLSASCAFVPPNASPVLIDEWLENDKALAEDQAHLSIREARAILAVTEPPQGNGTSGHYRAGQPNRAWDASRLCHDEAGHLSGTAWAGHAALAESLAAFVALPDCVVCGAPFDQRGSGALDTPDLPRLPHGGARH